MSRLGRYGPPAVRDSYSLLVLNVSFRTTADDLLALFDRCGEVLDIRIPRDRRTGDSRGFAFVRYKYEDEAQKAVDKLDGRTVDGRDIMVQFAKYGPNAERMYRADYRDRGYRDDYRDRHYPDDYQDREYRRSRSIERYERERYQEKGYRRRSRSISPDYDRRHRKNGYACGDALPVSFLSYLTASMFKL
uniref:RRM domain-containing protein n=1 Tax=Oryza glumipatula TaxID=40148 RepID=A0A0D9Z899_9ORYZ